MVDTAIFAQDDEMLQQTATRLIKALGVEMAIFICRSNYWHGVLKIIQKLDVVSESQTQAIRRSGTVHQIAFQKQQATEDRQRHEVAIAA